MNIPAGLLTADRIVIVGGPLAGKSTLARQLRAHGYTTRCGDRRSTVRQPEPDVTYLPDDTDWNDASRYVAEHWLTQPGRWVAEGHVMARALRRQLRTRGAVTVDRVVVLLCARDYITHAQQPLATAVTRTWEEIAPQLRDIADVITYDQPPAWSPLDAVNVLAAQASQLRS